MIHWTHICICGAKYTKHHEYCLYCRFEGEIKEIEDEQIQAGSSS